MLCSYYFTTACGRTRQYRSLSGCPSRRTHVDLHHPTAPPALYWSGSTSLERRSLRMKYSRRPARRSLPLPPSLAPSRCLCFSLLPLIRHGIKRLCFFRLVVDISSQSFFFFFLHCRLPPEWRPRSGGHVGGRQHRSYLEFHVCWLWRQCKSHYSAVLTQSNR